MRAPARPSAAPPVDARLAVGSADDHHRPPQAAPVVSAERRAMGERRRSRRHRRRLARHTQSLRMRHARLVAVRGRSGGQRVKPPQPRSLPWQDRRWPGNQSGPGLTGASSPSSPQRTMAGWGHPPSRERKDRGSNLSLNHPVSNSATKKQPSCPDLRKIRSILSYSL